MITDITIENQILRELKEAAQIDYLTGLYNRRYLFEVMKYEIDKACKLNKNVSLIIFDIDYFKKINDKWGHQVGDEVLKSVAKNNVREIDLVGRYGGEEFVILLPNTLGKDAVVIAEKLRHEFEIYEIISGDDVIHITVSFGISQLTLDNNDSNYIDSMIKSADDALYKAKQMGRNRVERSFLL